MYVCVCVSIYIHTSPPSSVLGQPSSSLLFHWPLSQEPSASRRVSRWVKTVQNSHLWSPNGKRGSGGFQEGSDSFSRPHPLLLPENFELDLGLCSFTCLQTGVLPPQWWSECRVCFCWFCLLCQSLQMKWPAWEESSALIHVEPF